MYVPTGRVTLLSTHFDVVCTIMQSQGVHQVASVSLRKGFRARSFLSDATASATILTRYLLGDHSGICLHTVLTPIRSTFTIGCARRLPSKTAPVRLSRPSMSLCRRSALMAAYRSIRVYLSRTCASCAMCVSNGRVTLLSSISSGFAP